MILSDLHAYDARFAVKLNAAAPSPSSPGKPSWLDFSNGDSIGRHPIDSFLQLIQEKAIRADVLIVPGDICDRANGDALDQAWHALESVRAALYADTVIATAGNHDLDSRYRANSYDPTAALKALTPPFPVSNPSARADFWAYHMADLTVQSTRFLVINSCAFHGGAPSEIDHGRISPEALALLRQAVRQPSSAEQNVVICHHHPHPMPSNISDCDDRMLNGEGLLDCLDESPDDWLVIHGHRHIAHIAYAAGSAGSPTVLAAASAAVRLDPRLATVTRNQAHLVTLAPAAEPAERRGLIESWNYTPSVGWQSAGDDLGLPHLCGFGYRGSMRALAKSLAAAVAWNGGPLSWSEVVLSVPEIQFLTPRDFRRVRDCASALGIQLLRSPGAGYEAASI